MSEISKVVIPVAGLGTRFAPATKAIPKEMLPVVDTPAIQYVVEEAVAAGLTDVLMVTGRGKEAIENHFDHVVELEQNLEAKGDSDRLAKVNASTGLANIHYVRQGVPLGLGHAVNAARAHVAGEPFAVQLGDDLIDERHPILPDMVKAQEQLGGSVIALMEVPEEQISLYGCAEVAPADPVDGVSAEVHRVTSMVEKPEPSEAPSNLAMIGRYVLHPAVFDVLDRTGPAVAGRSSSPMHSPSSRTCPLTRAAGCTGWSSAASATIPATASTTSRPSSSSPSIAPTSARTFGRGSTSTWRTSGL